VNPASTELFAVTGWNPHMRSVGPGAWKNLESVRLGIALAMLILTSGIVRADAASDLSAARAMWKTMSVTTYSFVYTEHGDIMIAPPCNWGVLRTHVKNGRPTLSIVLSGLGLCPTGSVLPASERGSAPRTIEALFAIVERQVKLGPTVVRLEVSYDPSYGLPVHLRAEKLGMSDSDEGFEITDFSPGK
jgi:hypothetical protein